LKPPAYSCESPNCPKTIEPRAYSINFLGMTNLPADNSKPWSNVEATGSGPSASKSFSQRK